MPVLRKEKEMEEKEVVIRIRHLSKEYRLWTGDTSEGSSELVGKKTWETRSKSADRTQRIYIKRVFLCTGRCFL